LNYVASRVELKYDNNNVLSIKSDKIVDGAIAHSVINFSTEKLNRKNNGGSRSIYGTLIETMANTRNHAYGVNRNDKKWWLISCYDEENKRVNFTFMDNGIGIPFTLRKNFKEKFIDPFINKQNDGKLILSALKGEFRTRTKKHYRGTGLPKILNYSKEKQIENLIIISNKGYVECNSEQSIELSRKFYGTLLSWDFV
jgi:hypothetical protein